MRGEVGVFEASMNGYIVITKNFPRLQAGLKYAYKLIQLRCIIQVI